VWRVYHSVSGAPFRFGEGRLRFAASLSYDCRFHTVYKYQLRKSELSCSVVYSIGEFKYPVQAKLRPVLRHLHVRGNIDIRVVQMNKSPFYSRNTL
jgi:hypothetical protein